MNRADLGHLPDVFVDGDIWEELRVELEAAKVAGSVAPDALVVLLTSTAATCFSSESLSGRGRLRCRPKKGSMLLSSAPNEGTDEGPGDERLTVFLLLSLATRRAAASGCSGPRLLTVLYNSNM